jgi:hypothetical protein
MEKKKVEQIFLDAQGAEDTIRILQIHIHSFHELPSTEPILEKQPKEEFPLILTS